MNACCCRALPLVGRILLALIFVWSGYGKFAGFAGTVGYIASKGLPLPEVAAALAAAVELGGGVLLIVGWKTRWAAAAIALFSLAAAFFFHNFWAVPADMAQNQMIHFMKNIAMVGGLLYVVAYGPGPWSVDGEGQGRC
ncbi:DoxX family protein [Oryzomicrobium sp.]|uniref:DoxX family protein n=1 Tax=Oryzomicrobium sp. TaxID=1911578 RepID=UPI002FE1B71E